MNGSIVKKKSCYYVVVNVSAESAPAKQKWISGKTPGPWMRGDPKPWRTRAEAEDARVRILHALQEGRLIEPSRMRVGEYFDGWIKRAEFRTTTLDLYKVQISAYIKPGLGNYRLQELRGRHLTAFYRDLRDRGGRRHQGLSRKSIKNIHSLVHSAFRDAVRDELLPENPADKARLPRFDLRADEAPIIDEALELGGVARAIEAARGHRLFPLLVLYATTGLRRGEALGLKWQDYSATQARLEVRRTLTANGQFAPPKTRKSNRTLYLPPELTDMLDAHKAGQNRERLRAGSAWQDSELVFCAEDGSPLKPSTVSRQIQRLLADAGLDGTVRRLRTFWATEQDQQATTPRVASDVLGHESVSTTQNTYTKPRAEAQRAAVQTMWRAMFRDADPDPVERLGEARGGPD